MPIFNILKTPWQLGSRVFDGRNEPDRLTMARNLLRLKKSKKYQPAEYQEMLRPYRRTHKSLTHIDFVQGASREFDKVLLLRHDVDHDIATAVKIAEWEAEQGLKAIYCILHTAWYYGRLEGSSIRHYDSMINAVKTIQDMGHEINFHNNLVVTYLQTGIEPVALLKSEMDYFESQNIRISGTSTHGDALCRELNFRNWELFAECCDERFGGPREIEHDGRKIELGQYSMRDLGLEYEAYDIARDVYHTDSGGRRRTRQNTRGRRDFGRQRGRGEVVGVLTHPIWWDFGAL